MKEDKKATTSDDEVLDNRGKTMMYAARPFLMALDIEASKRSNAEKTKPHTDRTLWNRNDLLLEALAEWAQKNGINETPYYTRKK